MPVLCVCKTCKKEYTLTPKRAAASDRYCSVACWTKAHDIAPGSRYGRWVVLRFDHYAPRKTKGSRPYYLCRCDCGTVRAVCRRSLITGGSRSCGCYHTEVSRMQAVTNFTKHGCSKNPDHIRALKHRRYHCDRGWTPEMEALLFLLQPACVLCGTTNALELDHVLPVISGGRLEPGNVVILCRSCNAAKHSKPLSALDDSSRQKLTQSTQQFLTAWCSR